MKPYLLIANIILIAVGAMACQSLSLQTQVPVPTVTQTALPQSTVRLSPTASPTATPTPTAEGGIVSLTLWTVEEVSAQADGDTGDYFTESLEAFKETYPLYEVDVVIKKPSGKGGILDFLRTANTVAPSVLPDVAIMLSTDLSQAHAENLIRTLNGRLDRSIVQDLLPAARRIGTVDERLVGVPIGLELEHLVYHTDVLTHTALSWTDILTNNETYLFPAKGVNGLLNEATLALYFSAGGNFQNDSGQPSLNEQALRRVLDFYSTGVERGVIDRRVLDAASTQDLWPLYLNNEISLTNISARQYLTDRTRLSNTRYAPIPVPTTGATPIAVTQGWVLTLVTNDANRQEAALRLLEWFLDTETNATWNQINHAIPSRDTAYQQVAADDPYWVFLTEQLNTARPLPRFAGYDRLGRVMQQAVEQVIRGEATPDEAVATVVDALTN